MDSSTRIEVRRPGADSNSHSQHHIRFSVSSASSSTTPGAGFHSSCVGSSPQSISLESSGPASALNHPQQQQGHNPHQKLPPSPYISPVAPQQQNFLPTPVSQTSFNSSFPSLPESIPEEVSRASWFDHVDNPNTTNDVGDNTRPPPPTVRVDPALDYAPASLPSSQRALPLPSSSLPASQSQSSNNMSAVATLQFDPAFNMGSRPSYGWSVLDSGSNGSMLGHDLGPYNSDASLTPPSGSRSATSSPPRASLTPEQRELKRQRDQARREAKYRDRQRRGTGNYMQSPPATLADLSPSASDGLPVYTAGPTQISLLTEPTTTLAPSSGPYMAYSPQLSSQSQSSSMFPPAPYQQQPYMSEYQQAYPASSAPSLPSHYGSEETSAASTTTYPSCSPAGTLLSAIMLTPPPSSRRPPIPHPHEQQQQQQQSNILYPMPIMDPRHEGPNGSVRVVHARPKPQCWEHGCNGRQFSTFSNLLRHQREKSGQAAKAVCPNCGAEFTRTTARNGHMQHEKCKPRRGS